VRLQQAVCGIAAPSKPYDRPSSIIALRGRFLVPSFLDLVRNVSHRDRASPVT